MMAGTRDLTLVGNKRLARKLGNLAKNSTRNRMMRQPLSNALTPISKAAKALVPVETKTLRKSIGKKVKTYPGGIWGGVGPRTDTKFTFFDEAGRKHKASNYAHLVEFGTIHSSAKPFLRPAFRATRPRALRIYQSGIAKNLAKEAVKR